MSRHVLFVAAENGGLSGSKVGGVGDVVRDLPVSLAEKGWMVTVVTPEYGLYKGHEGFEYVESIEASFSGQSLAANLIRSTRESSVQYLLIEHPWLIADRPGQIYTNEPDEPFATDATRFALFSTFVAAWLKKRNEFDVVHLHDWHTAPLLLLREFCPAFSFLRKLRCVFSIHNLAMQGVRPLLGHSSSLFTWYPDLTVDERVVDPRWPDCVNLMRAGIQLADKVGTVSPAYARDIQTPNDPEKGKHGAEGLESDIREVTRQGRLIGILNGCDYPECIPGKKMSIPELLRKAGPMITRFAAEEPYARSAHLIALEKIRTLKPHQQAVLVTSIGRLTEQKAGLLQIHIRGKPVLHHLLNTMSDDGLFVMLGTGDPELESFLVECSALFSNLLIIRGFDEGLAHDLYRSGNIFLMPSLFEPCGISQMLAMRAGQPCVVTATGGLKDTVTDNVTGWTVSGSNLAAQANALIDRFETAFTMAKNQTPRYREICRNASTARFRWGNAATRYINELYLADHVSEFAG